jgi:hypothetical protein
MEWRGELQLMKPWTTQHSAMSQCQCTRYVPRLRQGVDMQLHVGLKVLPTDKCCRFLDNQIFFIQDVPVRAGKRKASVTFLEVGQP